MNDDKGKNGGKCYRKLCNNRPANWFNPNMGYHYCSSCAQHLNTSVYEKTNKMLCKQVR